MKAYSSRLCFTLFLCFIQSFTQSLKRRMSLKNTLYSCGVIYEIVSNIPKVLLEVHAYKYMNFKTRRFMNILLKTQRFIFVIIYSSVFPGVRGARGEGDLSPHGCSRGQRRNSGWGDVHREIHQRSFGSGEYFEFGEATTGIRHTDLIKETGLINVPTRCCTLLSSWLKELYLYCLLLVVFNKRK